MMSLIKSEYEIKLMREIGSCIANILDVLIPANIHMYTNTLQLADQIEKWLNESGITSIKNFSIDGNLVNTPVHISVAHVVVHGLPAEDIAIPTNGLMRVDLVGFKGGVYSDAARTYEIGTVTELESRMTSVAYSVLALLESEIKPYDRFSKISKLIERTIMQNGFATSSTLSGHGIGAVLHDWPAVYNYYNKEYFLKNDFLLQPNMTFAIEPVLFEQSAQITFNEINNEIYVASEHSICSHVENTYVLLESGLVPLTAKV